MSGLAALTMLATFPLITFANLSYAAGAWLQSQTEPADKAKVVSKLISNLKDQSYWPDQYRAAEALGRLGPAAKDAVPALAAALKDPERFVRMSAARALGQLGAASKEALPALAAALNDSDSFVRGTAARTLGRVGAISPEVWAPMKEAAKDKDLDVQRAATEAWNSITSAWGKLGPADKGAIPALAAALKDAEPPVRTVAARALGKVGSGAPAEALAALKAALKDPEPQVSARPTRHS